MSPVEGRPNTYYLNKTETDQLDQHPNNIWSDMPRTSDGGKIFSFDPGNIMSQMEIENFDRVTKQLGFKMGPPIKIEIK